MGEWKARTIRRLRVVALKRRNRSESVQLKPPAAFHTNWKAVESPGGTFHISLIISSLILRQMRAAVGDADCSAQHGLHASLP